jgi:hypothetical protein
MRRLAVMMLGLLLFGAVARAAWAAPDARGLFLEPGAQRVALVMGNAAYTAGPLANPVNDARAMRARLDELGFEVMYREDADRATMEEAVRDFVARIRGGAVALFYYAGHGVQVAGRNYLIPVDVTLRADYEVRYKALDAGYLLDAMESTGNRMNVVILDACRDNPFARSQRSVRSGLAQMTAPAGSLIAYATAPGATAADGDGSNGVYTKHLLDAMTAPGLPVEQVFKRVRRDVMAETGGRQVPWESSSLVGNFTFVAADDAPAASPAGTGGMRVETDPPGAEVWVDGSARGSAPLTLADLEPGRVSVRAEKPGYAAAEERVRVRPGKVVPLTLRLSPLPAGGALRISSTPEGAAWYLDGDYMGVTPDRAMSLKAGDHRVRVGKPGHPDWQDTIRIEAGKEVAVHARLQPARTVSFDKKPKVAQYGGASYDNVVQRLKNTDVAACQEACAAREDCDFFFYNARGNLIIGHHHKPPDPSINSYRRECVLMSGKPWWGSAPQSDGYVKTVDGRPVYEVAR